ncbi:Beta-fructofuranosidase, insoluble isoenzyme CWINV3 [Hibiscus syriacus]|uniref:Beta-fructofuranosidase, insoluble isoenzyme CWINV3 n=1 Tax=Hibiscus syriacus TaxID=106335 RepID=A0A6A2ZAS3_HIBSY|nr:Beta-fructofuranosidase, insoluble isoenzyme CWINV3 [Hibiscus syriacus]
MEQQPYRTAYHFQPPKNWMNGLLYSRNHSIYSLSTPNAEILDINLVKMITSATGPMYYKGVYHLFYQYNPYASIWGNITWAHSISYDLVNWIHLDNALSPDEPFDINGCWSGSTTFLLGEKPVILYTGSDTMNRQVQNLAEPKNLSDPLLIEWVKSSHNPLMAPVDGIDPKFFRDPTTAWQGPDGLWRVLVGNQMDGHGWGLLYRSRDFATWTRSKEPLHSSTRTGMWECPDFYPVLIDGKDGVDTSSLDKPTKHVLKASFNDCDHYFYASKTFFDSDKKRRILWGWILEFDHTTDDIEKGWSGLQSIPRSILLGKTGKQLIQWPVEEIEKQHAENVSFKNKELKGGSVLEVSGITAFQIWLYFSIADVEVSFDLSNLKEAELMHPSWMDPQLLCSQKTASVEGNVGPFGILAFASKDFTEQTTIFFCVFRSNDEYVVLMCSDQSRSSLREGLKKETYGAST